MSVINRGRAVIWGIESEEGDTYAAGLIVSQEQAKESATAMVKDQEGHTVGEVIWDDKDQCSVDVDCESGAAIPAIGDDVVIAGIDAIVQSASIKWENEKIKRLSIKATKFALLTEGT